ncbi:hypothetical protein MSUIS_04370 [Mycoplasma suis KI3806]|uniref:Uncharacterized protein n=1 Tax=Mycoplasma suis (strain KI_3806) TaxID=708248 RepID=F0V1J9_MYCS3|nr:hypothetical protein [Mycoplasma suis]CBZ40530.1 hypothetical protein MSUIS_04370 [Mycoplasma suis KI3806]
MSASSFISPFLGIGFVLLVFWYISRKKSREEASKKGNKNDLWYLVKEYLKVTDRQGYRIVDLTFYSRTNTISFLREQILENKEFLEKRREKLFNLKKKRLERFGKKLQRKLPIKKVTYYPEHEDYHRKIELYTLKVIANKNSTYGEYLQEYEKYIQEDNFRELLKQKLIGEALSKITKNKTINSRNRFLVCFKTMNKSNVISDWEAIEIELFKNTNPNSKEKFKVLFTASINYEKELHWIYSQQYKYERGKVERVKSLELEAEQEEKRLKRWSKIQPLVSFPKECFQKVKNKFS